MLVETELWPNFCMGYSWKKYSGNDVNAYYEKLKVKRIVIYMVFGAMRLNKKLKGSYAWPVIDAIARNTK